MTRSSDPGYRILAARSLRKQIKQLTEHLGGIRLGQDIEAIHHARVASRRLCAALDMFDVCWKRKQVKEWKKQIRQLARSLGEARDHDVLIEFLVSSLATVADRILVPGIACLLNHVERQRLWLQPRVLKAIDQFEVHGTMKAMQDACRSFLEDAGDKPLTAGKHAHNQAGKSVRKGFKQLVEEAAGLADPEKYERHHAMRIAAKRLRYTLELARPVYASNLVEIGDTVKKLQTLLGEIHDCDVWIENFAEFAQKESCEIQLYFGSPQRFERLRPGLDYLRQERQDRRGRAFHELVTYWQELEDRGTWDNLATILEWNRAGVKSEDSSPAEVATQM